jgi:3-oxoacyl-[acyl-carrier protein] reductase
MKFLEGKTALVTGASQGIGEGAALSLARYGANVAVNYRKNQDLAEKVCEKIRALGCQALPIQSDVTGFEAVQRMVEAVESELGSVDILVNNAGFNPVRNILEIEEDDWDWVLNLNLKAYYRCAKMVLPGMLERKDGRIINITSISGERGGFSCDVDYSSAKAGIMGFTRALARWAAPRGVLVNAVAPGYIKTDMLGDDVPPVLEKLINDTPLKRLGTIEEIGEVVAFLAGPGATFIVGEVVSVNGGAHIA